MLQAFKHLKAWIPPLAGLCIVFVSAGYAWSLKTSAAQEINQLHELGTTLDSAVQSAQGVMLSPEDCRTLEKRESHLRQRIEDVRKPALVQAELMASARKAQLNVREIQPIAAAKTPGAEEPSCANYRVSVTGSYQQIAEYLHLCRSQRLPVRVVGLRMGRAADSNGQLTDTLSADITVEAFEPPAAKKKGA